MKTIFFIITFLNFSFYLNSQSQFEMNEEANKKLVLADKKLNQIYQKLISNYKSDTLFISKLKISQRLWIQFRDAEMNMIYPEKDKQMAYGTVFPMCWSYSLEALTNERIKKLNKWLNGIDKGDVCSGSIRIK